MTEPTTSVTGAVTAPRPAPTGLRPVLRTLPTGSKAKERRPCDSRRISWRAILGKERDATYLLSLSFGQLVLPHSKGALL